jgi:hypothetical protein
MTAIMLGRIIAKMTNYHIRFAEKMRTLKIGKYEDKWADEEVKKAIIYILKINSGISNQDILQHENLLFYSYDRINGILEKSDKKQNKDHSWEWRQIFVHKGLYYHIENVQFTESELDKIREVAKGLFRDDALVEKVQTILDIASFLTQNNYQEKFSVVKKLIKCAEDLAPKDELDIGELFIKLKAEGIADIINLIADFGESGVKKALAFHLSGEDFNPEDEEIEEDEEEVENDV